LKIITRYWFKKE